MAVSINSDKDAETAWRKATEEVWVRSVRDAYSSEASTLGGMNTTMTMFLRSIDVTTNWEEAGEGIRRRFFGPVNDRYRSSVYRALRLGHAMAFPETAKLTSIEAAYLGELGRQVAHVPDPAGSAMESSGVLLVDVAYAFPGKHEGKGVRMSSTTTLRVERADAADWPVAATLSTDAGVRFEFRESAGVWIRPLVGPDGRSFVDETAFASACAGALPWGDHPVRVKLEVDGNRRAPVSVLESCLAWAGDGGVNARSASDRALEVVQEAGRLVSVDGIVHVECPKPALTVAVRTYNDVPQSVGLGSRNATYGGAVREDYCYVGWASGDVSERSDFGILPQYVGSYLVFGSDDRRTPWRADVPLDCPDLARDLASLHAKRSMGMVRFDDVDRGLVPTGDAQAAIVDMAHTIAAGLADDDEFKGEAEQFEKAIRDGDAAALTDLRRGDFFVGNLLSIAEGWRVDGHYAREDEEIAYLAP